MAIFKIIHVEVSKIFKDGLSLRGFDDIKISNCFLYYLQKINY